MPSAPNGRNRLIVLCATGAAGALGCFGTTGALDPLTELAWLALFAPAAGALCAAFGVELLPFGLALPVSWLLVLVGIDGGSAHDLASPHWASAALTGLFGAGHAIGKIAAAPSSDGAWTAAALSAGALLFAGVFLSGLSVGFGLSSTAAPLAREHPELARTLLDVSPLTLVFDCAGWDWTHAQPDVYSLAGIEWFQRRPYRGSLAGPLVLVVGLSASWLARREREERAGALERPPPIPWPCASTSARSPRS